MTARAAGEFRRTPIERADQRVSWERSDQAFFAAGACHVLAWVCRDTYSELPIGVEALRVPGEAHAFHVYATWEGWTFDHAGWHPEPELVTANAAFEGQRLERLTITVGLAEYCERHYSRMPHQYWHDPTERAREYVVRHRPPWDVENRSSGPSPG
jgi:hypothetical protein